MSKSSDALLALLGTPPSQLGAETFVFDAVTSYSISSALLIDARDQFFGALVSLAEAVKGLSEGYYSWGMVKLYYSVFYSIQSLLASESHGLIYLFFQRARKKASHTAIKLWPGLSFSGKLSRQATSSYLANSRRIFPVII